MDANYNFDKSFYDFIENHKNEDPNKLRLKKFQGGLTDSEIRFAIDQIECRQKAEKKIPSILSNKLFLFPTTLLAEQCTDEKIARIHSNLFKGCKTVLDITAGLCIDSFFISSNNIKTTSLEICESTADIDRNNMEMLGAPVSVINADANEFIKNNKCFYDGIFADPARRDNNNSRLYSIEDCSPNIIELIPYLEKQCKFLIVKASPMLDITALTKSIKNIENIWIIGLKNECKEILFKVNFEQEICSIKINTLNILSDNDSQQFSYILNQHKSDFNLRNPQINDFLYEPNCCIMKAGCHNEIQDKFPLLSKISDNSNLYTSSELISSFPGRQFKIIDIIPFKGKEIKTINKKYPQINVSTRNFILSSENLKKKLKVKDGGEFYLFGTTCDDNKSILIICQKVIS